MTRTCTNLIRTILKDIVVCSRRSPHHSGSRVPGKVGNSFCLTCNTLCTLSLCHTARGKHRCMLHRCIWASILKRTQLKPLSLNRQTWKGLKPCGSPRQPKTTRIRGGRRRLGPLSFSKTLSNRVRLEVTGYRHRAWQLLFGLRV